jgi:AcrR family transcriptional regulator
VASDQTDVAAADADATADADAVLDAAAACYLRFGVAKTTAADIARAAGTSRATLYRRHGTHEEILLRVLTRESAAMFVDSEAHLDGLGLTDPVDRTVEGMVFCVGEIAQRPVHAAVFTTESAAWVAARAIRMTALREMVETGTRPLLEYAVAHGTASEQQVGDLVEWILRILISYAAVPGPAGLEPDDIRRQIGAHLGPVIRGLLLTEGQTAPDNSTQGA